MTPDERDRLRTLEVELKGLKDWMLSIDEKVDVIVAATHMGKGAWILLLKLGGVLTAIAVAVGWLWDHFPGRHP